MMIFKTVSWRLACAGLLTATLGACGGGGGIEGGSVSNISASSVAYGRSMTVTVTGQQLEPTNYIKAEGCENPTTSPVGSGSTRSYVCTIRKVGPMTVRVHNQQGDVLGSVRVEVPMPQVRFNTRLGNILVELDPTKAPITVNNFLTYVGASSTSSFYTNTLFHRVIKQDFFIIQAGGFIAGPTPKLATRAPIALESNNGLKNLRGTIAMARTSAPNSATSQFYINVQDNPGFDYKSEADPGYAVFGKVIDGMTAMDAIQNEPTTTKTVPSSTTTVPNIPVTDVVITGVVQVQ